MNSTSREQQLQSILHSYLQAIDRGETPDRQAILDAHPALHDELAEYFDDASKLERLGKSLKTASLGGGAGVSPSLGSVRYFGDYELLEEIARGGMGVVYRAQQVSLNRAVALKMILKGELASEADVVRFRQEAEAAANLDHPNIVPIYEVGAHEGHQYFSMKLIETSKGSGVLTPRQVAERVAKVARAVHHAHQRGILHRDLKPSNILIDTTGEPHVADFGLAKKFTGGKDATMSGAIVGTPAYMAPEQGRAEKSLTTAADVWSLGAILYEWLTGQPPFRGDDVVATLSKVINDEPIGPRTLKPAIDRDLETICLKSLSKDPQRRYGSAEMLAEDLERFLRGEPIQARPTSRPERLLKWARRRPERAILYGLATLVLTVFVGWGAWHGGVAIVDHWARTREELRQLVERTQKDLVTGRTNCQRGHLDVGTLFLARGLRGAVALKDTELEHELRLELGRYAPLLPRLVAMSGHDAAQIYQGDPKFGVSLSRDGKYVAAADLPWQGLRLEVDAALAPHMLDPAYTFNTPWSSMRQGVAISPDGSRFLAGNAQYAPNGKSYFSIRTQLLNADMPEDILIVGPGERMVGEPMDRGGQSAQGFKGIKAAFSPDGSSLAFTRWSDVQLVDAVTGMPRERLPAHGIKTFVFSPDSKLLATVCWTSESQAKGNPIVGDKAKCLVQFWDTKTGKPRPPLLAPSRGVDSLAFSPDSKLLLTVADGHDGGPQMWDLATAKPLWPESKLVMQIRQLRDGVNFSPPLLPLLSFAADGGTFWTGLYRWETATGKLLGGVDDQCTRPLTGLTMSGDGRRVAVLGFRQSRWLDAAGKVQAPGQGIPGGALSMFETLLVWELPTPHQAHDKDNARPLAGTPEQITLWLQVRTGRELWDDAPLPQGMPELGSFAVNNMRDDLWLKCREKLIVDGGLPTQ